MSIAFVLLHLMVLVTTPSAVVLAVLLEVGGWGWPMEIRVFLIEIACVELRNRAPSSDSTADDMIVFMKVHKQ